jgi:murein DD-endopeptidase MepM/ murein hydrolase activator NlpD
MRERVWGVLNPALVGTATAAALLGSAVIVPSTATASLGIPAIAATATAAAAGPSATIPDLALRRQESLDRDRDAIGAGMEVALLTAHHKRTSTQASLVTAEIVRLRNLATFLWPTKGDVSSGFGWRIHPILKVRRLHNGADIGGGCNNPIYAAQSGVVVKTGTGYSGGSGNNVRIDHGTIEGHNIQTGYLHMTRFVVRVGQRVDKGDLVGYVGSTGLSTSCHLHLSLYKDGKGSDPLEYVKK